MRKYFNDPLWWLGLLFCAGIATGFSLEVVWWSGPAIVLGYFGLSWFMRNNP